MKFGERKPGKLVKKIVSSNFTTVLAATQNRDRAPIVLRYGVHALSDVSQLTVSSNQSMFFR